MCVENIIQTLNIDHSSINDEFNWVTNSSNPINTTSGQLTLVPSASTTTFRRGLGAIIPSNNRIRLRINLDLFRPQNSLQNTINVVFGVYFGNELIDEFTIYKQISVNQKIEYNFDRIYKYEELSGNISLKISFLDGWENQLLLDYTKCEHFNYCQENVRTYFILNNYLEDSLNSASSGIQLLEWNVDGVESLTPSFYAENNLIGGNLITRKFAKSDIDGSNRVSNNVEPNTFNPFVDDFGLEFDTINSFYGGKTIGTISGSNYGSEILRIGIDKPEILNGQLISKKGVFFIDADFTKSFRIVFQTIVNNTSNNVFSKPTIFRKYFIVWNAENCTKEFYYQDLLKKNPSKIYVNEDGFLSGITDGISFQDTINCTNSFSFNGQPGVQEMFVDFGTATGIAGINYNALNLPDKFEIEWNGQIVSSGYVGSNVFDQQLINSGVNPSEINTANPSNGLNSLTFFKSQEYPTTAIVRVTSPLNADYNFSGICPFLEVSAFTEITWNDTQTIEDRTGDATQENIYFGGVFFQIYDEEWERSSGTVWTSDPLTPNVTNIFNLNSGLNLFRLKAKRVSDDAIVFSNILQYLRQNLSKPTIQQIAFPLRQSTQITVRINVSSDGGSPLTECGVVYNQTGNPTISDNKFIMTNMLGVQDGIVTGLTPSTAYYFCAYAINAIGITYYCYNPAVFTTA